MTYEILLHKKVQTFFKRLDNSDKKKISLKINKLKENPSIGKPLSGNLSGIRSLRVDKFRILYEVREKEVIIYILDIGHRKNIYSK